MSGWFVAFVRPRCLLLLLYGAKDVCFLEMWEAPYFDDRSVAVARQQFGAAEPSFTELDADKRAHLSDTPRSLTLPRPLPVVLTSHIAC